VYDPRLWGIFSYLFLLAVLLSENYKRRMLDIILSSAVCISTFSRGPILVLVLLMTSSFLINVNLKKILIFVLVVFIGTIIVYSILKKFELLDIAVNFIETFNPFSKDKTSALGQRARPREKAMFAFNSRPLFGVGFGTLGYSKYKSIIKDAYLFTVLGELGVVGFCLFLFSFIELFVRRNIYALALATGLLTSMTGTDIPDAGFWYFLLLVFINSLFKIHTKIL
jgi:hypothetical protein